MLMRPFLGVCIFGLFLLSPTLSRAQSIAEPIPSFLSGVLLSSSLVVWGEDGASIPSGGSLRKSRAVSFALDGETSLRGAFDGDTSLRGALCGAFTGGICVPPAPKERQRERPKGAPPSEWQLLMFMALAGAVVSVVSSFAIQSLFEAVMVVPSNPTAESRVNASFAYTATNVALIPWLVAGTLYGLSRLSNNYGSNFWWMLLGAYAGQVVSAGIGLMSTLLGSGTDRFAVARIVTLVADGLLAATGAMLAYLFTRKPYEEIEHLGALLHLRQGRVHMGIPLPLIYRDAYEQRISMTLLAGRF
jgi:hypothetical protein